MEHHISAESGEYISHAVCQIRLNAIEKLGEEKRQIVRMCTTRIDVHFNE